MQLNCAISVCPNDLYIYGGLLNQRIANDYRFHIASLDQLNRLALARQYDVIKVSAGLYPQLENDYEISPVGASFGFDSGPKLVVRADRQTHTLEGSIATPSLYASANAVIRAFYPHLKLEEAPLQAIPSLVSQGAFAGGLVINESMGGLASYKLAIVCDLAQLWFRTHHLPLPLGLVVMHRGLGQESKRTFERNVRASLAWAKDHSQEALAMAKKWSLEQEESLLAKHIASFTNVAADASCYQQALEVFLNPLRADR